MAKKWDEESVWAALRRLDICPSAAILNSPRRPDWCPTLATVREVTGLKLSEVQERLGWCPRGRGQPNWSENYYTSCRSPLNS